MWAELLAVQVYIRQVIGRSEINEQTCVIFLLIIERFLVPDRTLIEEQSLILRVPIAGHIYLFGSVEIIFDQVARAFGFCVLEVTVRTRLIAVIVIPSLVGVDNYLPPSVEVYRVTPCDISNQGGLLLGLTGCNEQDEA